MDESKCLVCFKPLGSSHGYHPSCSENLFGAKTPPVMDLSLGDLESYALEYLSRSGGIPGVQKKLSLEPSISEPQRLTISAMGGRYILKPQSPEYSQLPENEALIMELGQLLGLPVARHGLFVLADGSMAYITRRFDRGDKGERYHQEDFCQLSNRLTSDKYKGSCEQASKSLRFSSQAQLDKSRYFDLLLFSWLFGNADMHLKNFSLLQYPDGMWRLSPAYDLLSTALVIPDDHEELALPLQGKKARLNKNDWREFSSYLGLPPNYFEKRLKQWATVTASVKALIAASFLTEVHKTALWKLFNERWNRIA